MASMTPLMSAMRCELPEFAPIVLAMRCLS